VLNFFRKESTTYHSKCYQGWLHSTVGPSRYMETNITLFNPHSTTYLVSPLVVFRQPMISSRCHEEDVAAYLAESTAPLTSTEPYGRKQVKPAYVILSLYGIVPGQPRIFMRPVPAMLYAVSISLPTLPYYYSVIFLKLCSICTSRVGYRVWWRSHLIKIF